MNNFRNRRGQGILELAIVLPLLIMISLTCMDFARAFHCWSTVNHMCVEAARVACKRQFLNLATDIFSDSTHSNADVVRAEFWKYTSPLTPVANITGPNLEGVGTSQKYVKISASFRFEPWAPGIASLIGVSSGNGAIILTSMIVQQKE